MKQRQLGSTARVGNDEAARIEAHAHQQAIRPWLLRGRLEQEGWWMGGGAAEEGSGSGRGRKREAAALDLGFLGKE